ncbi:MAG TPA: tetratricopeptide repeat protein [Ignavibacteriaceae bacterium]|nr:tetratricopeptide repeat protein [Ignavibacteriaceae bacterium]
MKQIIKFFVLFLILSVVTSEILAQEMEPEAAKLYNQGNEQMKEGNFNGAIDSYDKALQKAQDHRIYYQKAIAQKKSNKVQESVPTLQKAIELNPKFEIAYNALGGSFFSLNNMEEAIKSFEKVIEISTNKKLKDQVKEYIARSYAKLGNNALADGSPEKAVQFFNKAIENHNLDAAYLALAKAHTEAGNWDNAISAGENALKYRSSISKGGAYYYIGLAYKGKGDMNKAKENFNLAKADPTYRATAEYELKLIK